MEHSISFIRGDIFSEGIDIRNICCGVNFEQWSVFGPEMFRLLKPGGWAQCTETSPPQWDTDYGPADPDWSKVRRSHLATDMSLG